MKKVNTLLVKLSALFLCVIGICFSAFFVDVYTSNAFRIEVIDSRTRQPIPNVIIAANWQIQRDHAVPIYEMTVVEVVTDDAGVAQIPGWGPKVDFTIGALSYAEPTVRLFKLHYLPRIEHGLGTRHSAGKAKWRINDASLVFTFELVSYEGSLIDYEAKFLDLTNSLEWVYSGLSCSWTKMPRLLAELEGLRTALGQYGAGQSITTSAVIRKSTKCGSSGNLHED